MKLHPALCAAVMALGSATACAADDATSLLGAWQCQSADGPVSLEFQRGGRFVFDGEPGRYTLQQGTILVEEDFGPVPYGYALQGDRLTVQFPDGGSLRCTRAAAGGQRPSPAAPPASAAAGGENALLRGRLCNWGGSSDSTSGYSRITSMVFDGAGNVVYSSEATFSSGAGGYYGQSGGTPGHYHVMGDTVQIRLEDGSSTTAHVHMRQNDGRITELMINGKLWAGALCE
jgi:hypothetical protein